MNVKLNLCCACVVAVLSLCTVGVAEIVDSGYWDGGEEGGGSAAGWYTYSTPAAYASTSTNFSWAFGDGWYGMATTEAEENLHASITIYCYAEAEVTANGDTGAYAFATAEAMGKIAGRSQKSVSASAYADYSDPDFSSGIQSDGDSRDGSFLQNTGFHTSQNAAAVAYVTYGGPANAFAHGCTHAYGTLY